MIYTAGITSCTENRYVTGEHGLHSEIGLLSGQLEAPTGLTNQVTSTWFGKSPAESSTGQMGSRERVDPIQSPFFVGEEEDWNTGGNICRPPECYAEQEWERKKCRMQGKGVPGVGRGVLVACAPSSLRVHRSSLFPPALSPSQPYLETVSPRQEGRRAEKHGASRPHFLSNPPVEFHFVR